MKMNADIPSPPNAQKTRTMILSTIENNHAVYRWFYFLIHHPDIRQELIQQENIPRLYQQLQKTSLFLLVVHFLIILCLCLLGLQNNILLYLPAGILFYLCITAYRHKKIYTQQISQSLLTADLIHHTGKNLYHMGEYFSDKLAIPSLVDTITRRDNIIRRTFLFSFIALVFILQSFHSWQPYVILLLSYYFAFQITNTGLIYKKSTASKC